MEETNAIGQVVVAARDIEGQLMRLGATGNGMRERLASIEHGLSSEVVAKVRGIGEQRNRLAHETGAALEPHALHELLTECRVVLAYLSALERIPAKPEERAALLQKATGQTELSVEDYYKKARGEPYQAVAPDRVPELLQKVTGQTELSPEDYYEKARARGARSMMRPDDQDASILD